MDTVGLEGLAGVGLSPRAIEWEHICPLLQCDFPGKPNVAMGTVDGDLPVHRVWLSEVFTWSYREGTIPFWSCCECAMVVSQKGLRPG